MRVARTDAVIATPGSPPGFLIQEKPFVDVKVNAAEVLVREISRKRVGAFSLMPDSGWSTRDRSLPPSTSFARKAGLAEK